MFLKDKTAQHFLSQKCFWLH